MSGEGGANGRCNSSSPPTGIAQNRARDSIHLPRPSGQSQSALTASTAALRYKVTNNTTSQSSSSSPTSHHPNDINNPQRTTSKKNLQTGVVKATTHSMMGNVNHNVPNKTTHAAANGAPPPVSNTHHVAPQPNHNNAFAVNPAAAAVLLNHPHLAQAALSTALQQIVQQATHTNPNPAASVVPNSISPNSSAASSQTSQNTMLGLSNTPGSCGNLTTLAGASSHNHSPNGMNVSDSVAQALALSQLLQNAAGGSHNPSAAPLHNHGNMASSVPAAPPPSLPHHNQVSSPSPHRNIPSAMGAHHPMVNGVGPPPQSLHLGSIVGKQQNAATVHRWSLSQLESHVKFLQNTNQQIPQPLMLLLSEARRREDKKTAKRAANRKSACTSRARKKALVEEMTKTNAKLKRQAQILALLPDLVIAITVDGKITFCSAQVERMLQHKIDDLIGAPLTDVIVPESRAAFLRLVDELMTQDSNSPPVGDSAALKEKSDRNCADNNNGQSDGGESASSGASAKLVSDASFPMSVVKLGITNDSSMESGRVSSSSSKNKKQRRGDSSSSNTKTAMSSLTCTDHSNNSNESNSRDSGSHVNDRDNDVTGVMERNNHDVTEANINSDNAGSDDSDDNTNGRTAAGININMRDRLSPTSAIASDDSSSEARKTSEALNRNVQSHNATMKNAAVSNYTDDVIGASVTANNAEARLSSLQHRPRKKPKTFVTSSSSSSPAASANNQDANSSSSGVSSDNSLLTGVEDKNPLQPRRSHKRKARKVVSNDYRNNQDSVGDSSASNSESEDRSSSDQRCVARKSMNCNVEHAHHINPEKMRQRNQFIVPTCHICVIRHDLTTLWCEVTCSVKTRTQAEESASATGDNNSTSAIVDEAGANIDPQMNGGNNNDVGVIEELLLCLRPIREGEEMVPEEIGFKRSSSGSGNSNSSSVSLPTPLQQSSFSNGQVFVKAEGNKPTRKRKVSTKSSSTSSSGNGTDSNPLSSETEKSVVESLMLMSSK